MKLDTTRKVDRYGGVALCCVLSGLRRMGKALPPYNRPIPPIRRIAFIKLAEQGATVLANGVLHRAADLVGRENIFFCVFEKNRTILDLLDIVPAKNVFVVRDDNFFVFVADVLRMLWRMRRERIDTTIDMELFARVSTILAFLSGARRRVGLHKFANEGLYRGDLLTHRVQYNPYHHMSVHYDVLFAAAQRDSREYPLPKYVPEALPHHLPAFEPPPEDKTYIEGLLEEHGVAPDTGPVVVFNPKVGDIMPIRRWAPEKFAALAQRLLDAYPQARIFITGLPEEHEGVDALCMAIGSDRAVNLAGSLNLRQLIGLLSMADALISTDSGPAHFAALTSVEVIVLFGSETPTLYGPLGEHIHPVYKGLACSPCLSAANMRVSFCRDNQCMKRIRVDEVFAATRDALDARHSTH
ncbi:MAG: glycosyltransferase family 9 protein [Candidatus Hydrogenedentota bacterium]